MTDIRTRSTPDKAEDDAGAAVDDQVLSEVEVEDTTTTDGLADYRTPAADFFEESDPPRPATKVKDVIALLLEEEYGVRPVVDDEAVPAAEGEEPPAIDDDIAPVLVGEVVLEDEVEAVPVVDDVPVVDEAVPAVEASTVDEEEVAPVQEEEESPAAHEEAAPVARTWEPIPELSQRKSRRGLWLGIPAAVIVAVAAVAATTLIAPGVVVAGVDIGWRTGDSASDMVAAALADTVVTLDTPSGSVSLTGEQLGLSIDPEALTALAYGDHPLWNVGSWNPGAVPIDIDLDADAALASLSGAAPDDFSAPTDAGVIFSKRLDEFTVTESASGYGIDFDGLASAVSGALSSGSRTVTFDATPVRLEPAISDAEATEQVTTLNDLVGSAGFYVDEARVVTIDPAQAASWLTITPQDGNLAVDVDTDAAMDDLWKIVASLPRTVNRPPTNELIVTNSAGAQLRTIQSGAAGWTIGATSGIAAAYLEAFAAGDSAYELGGEPVDFVTNLLFRSIEVNKTTGETILFENGKVVDVYPVAIGQSATPTPEGHFTVFWQLPVQDMGCVPGYDYCTRGVPWITYFAGDNGFHGTYWHDNFGPGAMMSHGCVNMTIAAAERVYYFAQEGTEVWVHS